MKYYNYLLILISISLLVFLSFFLLGNKNIEAVNEEKPKVAAITVSLAPPAQVEFCGKTVKLDRIDMRERYDRELNSFAYFHSTTLLLIKRANRYFPIIEPILKANNIPDDFKYLAVIESNLNPRALSPARAAGLWQFMSDTGKRYGLEISSHVDERYHIEKSTVAACRYLKEAYAKYGDWTTVAASYNAGMGRISSQLREQRAKDSFDLLLVEETSRYVFRMMAVKEIFSNPYRYGFLLRKENLYNPVRTKEVVVTEEIKDLAEFALKYDITYAQLKDFNIWLRQTNLPVTAGRSYAIAIPEKEDLFYSRSKAKVHDPVWIKQP
jgi:Soluble lytic murein transglycosylase and related regulatory proteins (some contain LysM/invasin domains)